MVTGGCISLYDKPSPFEFVRKTSFWRGLLFFVLAISLFPILAIAPYNHSCADDYSYGYRVHDAYTETRDPVEIVKAIGETVSVTYQRWQGTFSAIVLFSVQPAVWGEQFYFITTYFLLAFLLWGIFSFFRSWIGRIYGRNDIADIISCSVAILFVQLLPSPVEGLFWWNGASYYIFWNALMMLYLSQLIVLMHSRKCSFVKCTALALIGFLLGGANLITALLTLEVTALFLIYSLVTRNSRKKIGIFLLFVAVGFFINVTAPGNAARQQAFVGVSPLLSIIKSYYAALTWGISWTDPLLIALLVFLLPFLLVLQSPAQKKSIRLPMPIQLCILFSLFASLFTPNIFVGMPVGVGRIQNIRYLMWIIVCVMTEFIVVQSLLRWAKRASTAFQLEHLITWFTGKKVLLFLCVGLLVVGFSTARRIQVLGYDGLTSISATHSLFSKEAQAYDEIADQRTALLLSSERNVVLPAYRQKPFVLFFDDVTPDEEDWRNRAVARFYWKEAVDLQD